MGRRLAHASMLVGLGFMALVSDPSNMVAEGGSDPSRRSSGPGDNWLPLRKTVPHPIPEPSPDSIASGSLLFEPASADHTPLTRERVLRTCILAFTATALFLMGLAAYSRAGTSLRLRYGSLRMRHLHWRTDRRRRKGRRR